MYKKYFLFNTLIIVFSLLLISTNFNNFNDENNTITVNSNNLSAKTIYLTFDDGPSDNTINILEILNKYDISATFFVTGPSYKLKNDLLKQIINEGHSIYIHSYNHIYSQIYNSKEDYLSDFFSCYNWINKVTNTTPVLYRFPGGSSNTIANKSLIQEIIISLENNGFKHVDWNVDSKDSKYNNDTDKIINTTINDIKQNESNKIYNQIILFHDNIKKIGTIKALSIIIEYCLSKGYQFKSLTSDSPLIQHVKKPI